MHRSRLLQLPVLLLLRLLFLMRQSLLGLHCVGAAADDLLLLLLLCQSGHRRLQSAAPRGLLRVRCPPL
jgi:hypothetical protein